MIGNNAYSRLYLDIKGIIIYNITYNAKAMSYKRQYAFGAFGGNAPLIMRNS